MALRKNYVVLFNPAVMTVIVVVVLSFGCSSSSPQSWGVKYWVGDSLWTIPPFPDYYSNWSYSHFFKIGDTLVFDFETGRYNVIQVSSQEYESCTSWSPIKIINGGPAIIPLNERGVFYFICNFSNYCSLGQKISIIVNNCDEDYPPLPVPAPAPAPPSPPSQLPPSSPPYNNNGSEPSMPPVQSPAMSPIENGNAPEDNAAAPANSAAIMIKGKKSSFDSIGSIISGWGFGMSIYVVLFSVLGV